MSRRVLAISVPWAGLSMLGDGLSALLLPYLLLVTVSDDLQATTLGVMTLAGIGLAMVVQPVAGALSDALGRRRPLLHAGLVIALVGLALMGAGAGAGIAVVLIGYLAALAGANTAQAGLQALVPDEVPASWRGRAAGLRAAMDVGGAFVAFALLGALLASGALWPSVVIIGLALSLTLAPALLGRSRLAAGRRGMTLNPSILWRGLAEQPAFARLLVARFCFLLGIYAVGRFLALFMSQRLGLDADATAAQAGAVLALLALGTALGSIPAGWAADRFGRRPLMVAGAVVAAAGIGLLPLATSTMQIALLGSLLAIGTASFGAGSWALATDLVPADEAARQMGLANYATAGAAAMAGLFGPVVDAGERLAPGIGYPALMIGAALAAAVGGLVALRVPETTTLLTSLEERA